jgi:hypothetical protein
MKFILETDWIYSSPPIDFEHNQYKLLAYFQKIADKLNNFELYPYFIEISLHLANVQTLTRENLLVKTNKKFKSNDDELLITDLDFVTPPQFSEKEQKEIQRTLQFAAPKFQDYFNVAKSVWTLVYESTHVSIKKNKKNLFDIHGYFFYQNKGEIYLWQYELTKNSKNSFETKSETRQIYSGKMSGRTTTQILNEFIPKSEKSAPIFETFSNEDFPIYETLLPIFKRKIISYILQSGVVETYKKFV